MQIRRPWSTAHKPKIVDLTGFTGVAYAIGDVHGCLDLLRGLEAKIAKDAQQYQCDVVVIYLGDMIDRGPDSFGVIEYLMSAPPPRLKRICLMGNHEDQMLHFLRKPASTPEWLDFGGVETLVSYGAPVRSICGSTLKGRKIGFLLERIIPKEHMEFLKNLPQAVEMKDYFLSHAGINPAKKLRKQTYRDLVWGTEAFFRIPQRYEKLIVFGHNITAFAHRKKGLVAVDTGAYSSGKLSAVKLVQDFEVEFLAFIHNDR